MACSASLTALSGRWSIASASAERLDDAVRRLRAAELPVLELVDRALVGLALLLAVRVDERVGEDAVQPGLQVGALLELAERRVRLDERLLHEVLRVGRVPVMRRAAAYSWSMNGSACSSKRGPRSSVSVLITGQSSCGACIASRRDASTALSACGDAGSVEHGGRVPRADPSCRVERG